MRGGSGFDAIPPMRHPETLWLVLAIGIRPFLKGYLKGLYAASR